MKSVVIAPAVRGAERRAAEAAFLHLQGDKRFYVAAEAPDPAGFDLVVMGIATAPDGDGARILSRLQGQALLLFACGPGARSLVVAARAMAPQARDAGNICLAAVDGSGPDAWTTDLRQALDAAMAMVS